MSKVNNELRGNKDKNVANFKWRHVAKLTGQSKSFLHLNCVFWPLNRRRNQMKQSCIVKGMIETNQIRGKNIIVVLSNTTVAHFEVLFAVSLAEPLFSFFSVQYKGKTFGKTMSNYITLLEPIHVPKHFMTIFFLPYLHLLHDI